MINETEIDNQQAQALDMVPVGICRYYIQDNVQKLQFVNKYFIDMIGWTRDELFQKGHSDFLPFIYKDDRPYVEEKRKTMDIHHLEKQSFQFRLDRHDGTVIWVQATCDLKYDEAGLLWINWSLTDITALRMELVELQNKEAGYFSITEHMNEVIFQWDLKNDYLTFSNNFIEKFGYAPIVDNISCTIPASMNIHLEDIDTFKKVLESVRNGDDDINCEIRIKQYPDKYIWCKLRVTAQVDSEGRIDKAFGTLTDIDDQKKMLQKLLFRAQRDSLTGIYNKATTQTFIEECLAGDLRHKNHALFIIDIDNFKHVNDSLGHLFGDAVLKDTAFEIQRHFRDSDIIGRIGGDEFLVFLKDISSKAIVMRKAEALIDIFRRSFTGQKKDYKISGSVGIALYPRDGHTYQELFKNADNALYAAKKQGKDCYCMYSQELKAEKYKSVLDYVNLDEEPKMPFIENLKEYIFNILYESRDIHFAIPLMLEIVGKYYGVSRVYVFENSDDDLYLNNTFEWCNEGIPSEMENLQRIPYKMFRDGGKSYDSLFDENGVFYCNDITTLPRIVYGMLQEQNVSSTLQCAMISNDVFKGFVGFDECTGLRFWTQEEIDMLTVVSRVLTTFLLKEQLERKLNKMYQFQQNEGIE